MTTNPEANPAWLRTRFTILVEIGLVELMLIRRRRPSLIGIDSSVIVELVDLAVSSVGINSTAAMTVGYLSKSRSRRISGSLLIEVISLASSTK
ncbi:hypothetical protein ACFX13_035091 [Malus domestica]